MEEASFLPDYRIRLAKGEDDAERAGEIARRAWGQIHKSFREIMGEDMHDVLCANWEENKAEQIRAHWRRFPEGLYMVESVASGRVVAFVTFRVDREKSMGIIGNNAVDMEGQGKGIGTAMYRYILDTFRERGLRFAEVSTGLDEGHAPARRAYEKAGFDIRRENVTFYKIL